MPFLSGQEQSWGKELVHARASGGRWVKYFPLAVFGVWNPLSFANPCLGGGNVNAAQSPKMSLTFDMSQGDEVSWHMETESHSAPGKHGACLPF